MDLYTFYKRSIFQYGGRRARTCWGQRHFIPEIIARGIFLEYVAEKINGKDLQSTCIQEKTGGRISVILTYQVPQHVSDDHDKTHAVARRHVGNRSNFNVSSPYRLNKSGSKKHKTPSRRKRDRERFHAFVERKKARKRNQKSHDSAELCSPKTVSRVTSPVPVSVEVSPTATVTHEEPAQVSPTVSVTPQEETAGAHETSTDSVSEPESPLTLCICSVCKHFDDTDPLLAYYETCDNCGTPNTEDHPLKPCSRCRFRAYCTKECQKIAWRAHHKAVCTTELGEQARILKNCWLKSRGIWQQHMLEPHKLA